MKFYIIFLVITIFMVSTLPLYKAEELDSNIDYTFSDANNVRLLVVPRKIDNYNRTKPAIAKGYNKKLYTTKEIANNTLINDSKDAKQLKDMKLNSTEENVVVNTTDKDISLWEKLFGS